MPQHIAVEMHAHAHVTDSLNIYDIMGRQYAELPPTARLENTEQMWNMLKVFSVDVCL